MATQEPILALLRKHIDSKGKQAKLKSPQELQELLDVTRQLVRQRPPSRLPCHRFVPAEVLVPCPGTVKPQSSCLSLVRETA